MRRVGLCVVLFLSCLVAAQNQSRSDKPEDGAKPKLPIIRLQDGSISGLGPIYSHGIGFWVAATDRTAILASAEDLGDVLAVGIAIQNTSDQMFTFDPSEVKAFDIVGGKYLTFIPGSALAAKIRKPNAWARFGEGFSRGASLAAQETYQQDTSEAAGNFSGQTFSGVEFRGTFNASGTSGHMTCDTACVQARSNLLAQFAEADQRRAHRANAIEALSIEKQTLLPHTELQGYVYFSKPKKGLAVKPSGGHLDHSLHVGVAVPVGGDKYHLFFPTALFDELTKGPK